MQFIDLTKVTKMEISNQLIEQAYKQSGLNRYGVTLNQALDTPMFKTCLMHIAETVTHAAPKIRASGKQFWWQKESESV